MMEDREICPDCGLLIGPGTARCCQPTRPMSPALRAIIDDIATENEIDERATVAEDEAEADEWAAWLDEEKDA